ncbi:thioredoxin-like protein [Gymnopilus junonius]|uniref:glutathione transferase n=1 Tax=Gymnopilus junonius TaxID=109634 RepID=A0A9P5NY91_GYMJU|nr:thioredoxin-like protein [Gymnopilus junonius]
MVLKLYGHPLSTCTRRVATVLHEKQVSFEIIPVDFAKGGHKSTAYLEKQPFGQVSYIDDGFILFESRAISLYIASKYANQGTPSSQPNSKPTLSSNKLVPWSYATSVLRKEQWRRMKGLKSDKARFDEYIPALSAKLDGYERILSKQKYLAGDEITLADLYHLPYAEVLPKAGSNVMLEKPNVAR